MRTLPSALTAAAIVVAASTGYALAEFHGDRTGTQSAKPHPTATAADERCEQARDAYETGMQRAEVDVVAMKEFASTREMWPPSAKDFPALWTAQLGEATIDEVSEWQELKQTAGRSVAVAVQIVDDSPECFDPSLVAEVRTSLAQGSADGG